MKKSDHQKSDILRIQIGKGGVGRHETFTPRYGWLKKGYDELKRDSHIFNAPDAIERLGVGKNMVQSIRFWCSAFNLIQHENGKNNNRSELRPTIIADKILVALSIGDLLKARHFEFFKIVLTHLKFVYSFWLFIIIGEWKLPKMLLEDDIRPDYFF